MFITQQVDAWAAFLAGFLTFFTPCTIPLLPGWLALVGGLDSAEVLKPKPTTAQRLGVIGSTFLFIVGFSAVFIAVGAAASSLGNFFWEHHTAIRYIGASVMLVMALFLLGVIKPQILMGEKRFQLSRRPAGLFGAVLVGMAFAAGWTPCGGPVLGAMLSLAMTEENLARGTILLVYFSAGLGLPFLIMSIMWTSLMPFLRRLSPLTVWAQRVLGLMMLFLAALVMADKLSLLNFGY
ncbi:MAG: cytochrome c biogenesis protein CcdA [Deltaproteobacteria bacterium]|nr:cytochrome c biogenesis protein CcdA [Deltaproteobacteria bacterium]